MTSRGTSRSVLTLFSPGFVNVILLYATHRLIPDPTVLPSVAPRKAIDLKSPEAMGITPFTLSSVSGPAVVGRPAEVPRPSAFQEELEAVPLTPGTDMASFKDHDSDTLSVRSYDSIGSESPLIHTRF